MISLPPSFPGGRRRNAGLTLTELMVAATLGTIILAGTCAVAMAIMRTSTRVGNYSTMETETRMAFEQLAIDARMSNGFNATYTGSNITAFTLTIPSQDLSTVHQVYYGYDTSSDPDGPIFYCVPGNAPAARYAPGRKDLVLRVTNLAILIYDANDAPILPGGTSPMKHLQVSVTTVRSTTGVAAATQVIRSSAFTLRNI